MVGIDLANIVVYRHERTALGLSCSGLEEGLHVCVIHFQGIHGIRHDRLLPPKFKRAPVMSQLMGG
jgi:hypothetical protein